MLTPQTVEVVHLLNYLARSRDHDVHHGWLSRAYHAGGAGSPEFHETLREELAKAVAHLPPARPLRVYRGVRHKDRARYDIHWTSCARTAATFGEHVEMRIVQYNEINWVATLVRRICWPKEREISLFPR